jgi:hypothetical protein
MIRTSKYFHIDEQDAFSVVNGIATVLSTVATLHKYDIIIIRILCSYIICSKVSVSLLI